jgi:hypothetical protein
MEYCSLDLDGDPHGEHDYGAAWTLWHLLKEWPSDAGTLAAGLRSSIEDGRLQWVVEVETCARRAGSDADYLRIGTYPGADTNTDEPVELLRQGLLPAVGRWEDVDDGARLVARHGIGTTPASAFLDLLQTRNDIAWIDGDALAVDAYLTADGEITGVLGLGLRPEVRDLAAEMLADFYSAKLTQGTSDYAVDLDENSDGVVTPEEFMRDELAAMLLTLDIDLFAVDGEEIVYWPRHDRTKDRFAFGICFHATPIAVAH